MKPIFTIHAGEYLVGSYIEQTYKDSRVWLPSNDTGIDLLVTNRKFTRATSIQVKFSKDFLGNKSGGKNTSLNIETKVKAGGWWTLNHDKIKSSPADLWVLVLYRFSHRDFDFVVIDPRELLNRYHKLGNKSGTIQSYVWVTKNGKCWETRGLGKAEQEVIAIDKFRNPARDLSKFLNNWRPLEEKIGL